MTKLFAQPYNRDAVGFYFTSVEEYEGKVEGLTDGYGCPVEEYEIQFIDGEDDGDAYLFEACGIDQSNLDAWFDVIETLDDNEKAALFYLTDCYGYKLADALEKIEDVQLREASLLDAATEDFDEFYAHSIPESLRGYIDYESFANDLKCGGDFVEFEFGNTTYTCTNANGL